MINHEMDNLAGKGPTLTNTKIQQSFCSQCEFWGIQWRLGSRSLCAQPRKTGPWLLVKTRSLILSFMDGGRRSGLLFRQVQFLFNNKVPHGVSKQYSGQLCCLTSRGFLVQICWLAGAFLCGVFVLSWCLCGCSVWALYNPPTLKLTGNSKLVRTRAWNRLQLSHHPEMEKQLRKCVDV